MTIYYLDPSAWVKRYFEEVGSQAVAAIFQGADSVACSTLGMVEIAATIARKGRYEKLSPETLEALLEQARADFLIFEQITLSDEIAEQAERIAF